jgi:hypothetical protein
MSLMENPTLSTRLETPLLGLHQSANAEMGEYFGTVLLISARFSLSPGRTGTGT